MPSVVINVHAAAVFPNVTALFSLLVFYVILSRLNYLMR